MIEFIEFGDHSLDFYYKSNCLYPYIYGFICCSLLLCYSHQQNLLSACLTLV